IGVAITGAVRHSQLQGPLAGLAALFPVLCLARGARWVHTRLSRTLEHRDWRGRAARQPVSFGLVWLTLAVAVVAVLFFNIESSADQDARAIRNGLGATSMFSIIAP